MAGPGLPKRTIQAIRRSPKVINRDLFPYSYRRHPCRDATYSPSSDSRHFGILGGCPTENRSLRNLARTFEIDVSFIAYRKRGSPSGLTWTALMLVPSNAVSVIPPSSARSALPVRCRFPSQICARASSDARRQISPETGHKRRHSFGVSLHRSVLRNRRLSLRIRTHRRAVCIFQRLGQILPDNLRGQLR